jgi:AhpD family alkylhydroperoxidase
LPYTEFSVAHPAIRRYIRVKVWEIIMSERVKQFKQERERLNEVVLSRDDLNIKRFFGLDSAVYRDGALSVKTKELLGLVASLVLRCDDCITYHTIRAKEMEVTDTEFDEVMSIGLVVGGSITIPHVRRAYRLWEDMKS